MSYFPAGHRVTGDEIDDFDDCDLTHYAAGYDIDLTYGRSLPPSYETCYPYRSSASSYFDYNRPQFASHAKPSAYAIEALGNEYKSYAGPIPRPGPPAFAGGRGYSGPKPNYGFQPGGGGSKHGRRNEYARPEPEYGSGYSMKPPPPPGSDFGSSFGRNSEYESPGQMQAEPGAGYARNLDRVESGHGPGVYGWNTGRQPVFDFGGSGYEPAESGHRGWPEKPTFPMPSYPQPSYPRPSYPEPRYPVPTYPEPSYPVPTYPEPSYPIPSYPEPSYPVPSYPEPSYPMPSYPEPSYPIPSYGLKKYEHGHSDDKEGKHHHSHHHRRQ